jgi:N-acetylmuramic acid 6-phosphate (MurNAc-6-P) etherase
MSEIRAVNTKLRARALRTIAGLGGLALEDAERLLDEEGGSLHKALDRLSREDGTPRD